MKPRKILVAATIGLLSIGIVITAIPFFQSMSPTEQEHNNLPRVKTVGISPGEHKLLDYFPTVTSNHDWQLRAFVYRKLNGDLKVWRLFSKNGTVGMPDLTWSRPMFGCKEFGPTMIDGIVDETKSITCHDDGVPDYWRKEWRWTIEGKNLGTMVEDMDSVSGSIEGDFFVIQNSS